MNVPHISFTFARTVQASKPGRPFLKVLLAGLLMGASSTVQAAAYATGGTGKYKSQILWLTWGGGTNGTKNTTLTNGATTTATVPVYGVNMVVSCSLSGIGGGGITSYAPGGFKDDGLDNLYNIGGLDTSNTLVNGIRTGKSGLSSNFTVTCSATLDGKPYDLPGLVVADAESMAGGESIKATADGTWQVMERLTCGTREYNAELTSDSKTITFSTPTAGDCNEVNESGSGSNALGLTFLTFNSSAYTGANRQITFDVSIKGNGLTAVALGVLAPYLDSGDAPSSYGGVAHFYPPALTADGLSAGAKTTITAANFQVSTLNTIPATNKLGNQEDPDGTGLTGNTAATTDDTTGADDEDGVNASALPVLKAKSVGSYIVPVACSGTGTVKGWIDFNINGIFDAGESAQTTCGGAGSTVNLTFPIPADIKSGQSYLRVRYATNAAELALPSGIATSGEVEDYALAIYTQVTLTKTWGALAVTGNQVNLNISGGGLSTPQTKTVTAKVSDKTQAFVIGGTSATVGESGGQVNDYLASITCKKVSDGTTLVTGAAGATSASFTVPQDSNIDCTINNELRLPNVPQMKKYVRNLPSGAFGTATHAQPGTILQYCIAFQNTGNGPAKKFKLTDAFPANTSAAYPNGSTDTAKWNLTYSASGADLTGRTTAPTASALPAGATLTVGSVATATPSGTSQGIILDLGAAGLPAGGTGTVCFDAKIN